MATNAVNRVDGEDNHAMTDARPTTPGPVASVPRLALRIAD